VIFPFIILGFPFVHSSHIVRLLNSTRIRIRIYPSNTFVHTEFSIFLNHAHFPSISSSEKPQSYSRFVFFIIPLLAKSHLLCSLLRADTHTHTFLPSFPQLSSRLSPLTSKITCSTISCSLLWITCGVTWKILHMFDMSAYMSR